MSPDVAPGVVPPASTRRRVASNTAVQLAGKGAILAMGAVSITVVTRYLGPEHYGKYSLALLYTQLFGVVADVGLYTTVVRDISRDPSRTEELVGNVLVLRLALAIAVIAVGAGDQPGPALRPRRPRRHRARRRPAAVRDAHDLDRGGLPVAPADDPRGHRRRARPRAVALGLVVVVVLETSASTA